VRGMETALVAQQTDYIHTTPIRISLLTLLAIVVYIVLWSRKRRSRRKLKAGKKKHS
jgi:hypothetical protein